MATKYLYVVHCWGDFGDAESGPDPQDWYELIIAESIGDAWLKASGMVCRTTKDEDGKYFPDIRLANKRERKQYRAYLEEVRIMKEDYGITEDHMPFGVGDFVEVEEERETKWWLQ